MPVSRLARNTRVAPPPAHWLKALNILSQSGRKAVFSNTLAPVVVNAETLSKNAADGLVMYPLIRYTAVLISDMTKNAMSVKPMSLLAVISLCFPLGKPAIYLFSSQKTGVNIKTIV